MGLNAFAFNEPLNEYDTGISEQDVEFYVELANTNSDVYYFNSEEDFEVFFESNQDFCEVTVSVKVTVETSLEADTGVAGGSVSTSFTVEGKFTASCDEIFDIVQNFISRVRAMR